jgi:hypothetical protein
MARTPLETVALYGKKIRPAAQAMVWREANAARQA